MAKKECLDAILGTCSDFFEWVVKWEKLGEEELTPDAAELIDQQVRRFCAVLVRAAEDLRTETGSQPRPGGRPRLALPVEKIKEAYKQELLKRAGTRKVAVVELLASRFGVSKRTIYRVLATPDG